MFTSRKSTGGQYLEGNERHLQDQEKPTPRTLVYDVETGSLRFSKPRVSLKSPILNLSPSNLKVVTDGGKDSLSASHSLLNRPHGEGGSGESSPTCVIRNPALRSNSSSPTMSTMSKASSEMDRPSDYHDGGNRSVKYSGISPSHGDEEVVRSASSGSDTQKVGGVRGPKRLGSNTPNTPGLKGRKEEVKESQTAPFRPIQSMANKTEEFKKKHGGIPSGISARSTTQSASVMNGMPGIFSFNATYMSPSTESELYDYNQNGETGNSSAFDFNRHGGQRTVLGPMLKPTPSKWDDAEKWLAGSDIPVRAKARSGPLLAQMVANQAGLTVPRKVSQPGLIGRHTGPQSGVGLGAHIEEGNSMEGYDVKSIDTPKLSMVLDARGGGLHEFGMNEKEELNLLIDRYSLGDLQSRGDGNSKDGMSPSLASKGSFLKIVSHDGNPVVESPPMIDDVQKPEPVSQNTPFDESAVSLRTVSMRDMGTEMTPIASVEPSRTATPLRATTPEKSPIGSRVTTPDRKFGTNGNQPNPNSDLMKRNKEGLETPKVVLTGKELQAKTRQEILALGTQLGKANIAAWATKEEEESDAAKRAKKSAHDMEESRRAMLASRVAAWEEAEKSKYTSRYEREEAKIQAWENHEKAKAEAEMRRIEVKVERMRSHSNEKLMNKLAIARRQAEEFRAAAEARRAEAADKTAKRSEFLKKNGKLPSLLFLTYLCA